ncbi:hypothetical protein Pyrfu_0027 [Pyrolobus fumarii 1A]|uniref:Beta-ribofuranosylaminobenzene 5'-phosphate synthase n=1 Tax=Pyrolobus fumarii (strain DSM 11204 / 1A) TaxID=694429 RepID=G0EDY3_PYRF1|nr:hypothetical protein [Pyrolobus fumarii]AEM37899.1 hypothetical protein Pyrfu_0027 [Pyrolobus fumarii 1A]
MSGVCYTISVPSHVHAGNYEFTCDESVHRCFGTVGVALSNPRLVVKICKSNDIRVHSVNGDRWCRELENIARGYAQRVYEITGVRVTVELRKCYPWGAGLGARTALALAVADAALRLGSEGVTLEDVALELGRGWVSALGFYTYTRGGLVVDAGFEPDLIGAAIPPLVARYEPPIEIVVVLPLRPLGVVRRLKEQEEDVDKLAKPDAPPELSAKLARLLLTGFMGNLAAGRLDRAFRALSEMNREAGRYWAGKGQGGTYCCRETEEAIRFLERMGAVGVFQSSWGPAAWGVFTDAALARRAARKAIMLSERIGEVSVWHAHVDTQGAIVKPG